MKRSFVLGFLSGICAITTAPVSFVFAAIWTESWRSAFLWAAVAEGVFLLYLACCSIQRRDETP